MCACAVVLTYSSKQPLHSDSVYIPVPTFHTSEGGENMSKEECGCISSTSDDLQCKYQLDSVLVHVQINTDLTNVLKEYTHFPSVASTFLGCKVSLEDNILHQHIRTYNKYRGKKSMHT